MKNINKYTIIALISLLISCEKDITLDIPAGDDDVVVESWIYKDSGPLVMLSRQFDGYGSFNQATLIEESNVTGALVYVSENNGTKIQLYEQTIFDLPNDLLIQVLDNYEIARDVATQLQLAAGLTVEQQLAFATNSSDSAYIRMLNNFNFYIDTTNTLIGNEGASYQLEIETEDEILTAQTTIPFKIDVNYLTYAFNNDNPDLAQVYINLTVPDNYDAYVLFASKRNDNAYIIPDYFGGGAMDNSIFAGQGTIEPPLLRGYSDDEEPELDELGLFERNDEVSLKWQNIDEATYKFWYSYYNAGGDTPFSAATRLQSNINGGQGIWAGYNTSYHSITVN